MRLRTAKSVAQLAKGSRIQNQPDLCLSPLCTLGKKTGVPWLGEERVLNSRPSLFSMQEINGQQ